MVRRIMNDTLFDWAVTFDLFSDAFFFIPDIYFRDDIIKMVCSYECIGVGLHLQIPSTL